MRISHIKGYETKYQITENGDILSTDHRTGKIRRRKTFISTHGYKFVSLWRGKKIQNLSIHRLLAEHFIPNPNNYKFVRFLDGDKANIALDNLCWSKLRIFTDQNNHKKDIAVGKYQNTIDGIIRLADYRSIRVAAIANGISQSSISSCLAGKTKSAGGWIWKVIEMNY
jgi:hypothetical protein